ncbi:hypothetical protein [Aquimarina macrocephali]|uniref:hypothetical protein n=1 Tax=Aquimarina macrocephali TaxID=666563 RepID=UPI000463841F|nr:hypothetical protein [Aquimarina macrocephali]
MKTVTKLKKYIFVTIGVLVITSCEKTESDTEILNIKEQEGFMSTTGNSDVTVADDQSGVIKPIFHMSFSAETSKAEALAKFEKNLTGHKQKTGFSFFSGSITKIPFRITTMTGTNTHEGTNGVVKIDIVFKTDKGIMTKRNFVLQGGREQGSIDTYELELTLPKPIDIEWMEIESATIKLQGTDGWRFRYISIYGYNEATETGMQFNSKTGFNKWLDSTCNTCWDSYTTISDDFIESGRYYF